MSTTSHVLTAPEPASDCLALVACDARYAPYAAVLARQLAALPGRDFDVAIGSPEVLSLSPHLGAEGIGHVAVTDTALAEALPLDTRRSLATYMTVFAPTALRGLWRRVLVLDADILFERGDPAALMRAEMHGQAVAAVRDNRQWRTPGRRVDEFRALGLPAAGYFNAGVVLADTEAWAAQDMPARCADFARRHLAGLGRDQALLNGVLHGAWAEISPLWNWQFTWASAHLTAMADPCIVHFIGPEKPWLARSAGIVPMRYRAPYAGLPGAAPDLTQRVWPDRRRLARTLLRQWRASGPMLDYLGRFADEYTLVDPA